MHNLSYEQWDWIDQCPNCRANIYRHTDGRIRGYNEFCDCPKFLRREHLRSAISRIARRERSKRIGEETVKVLWDIAGVR